MSRDINYMDLMSRVDYRDIKSRLEYKDIMSGVYSIQGHNVKKEYR